MAADASPPSDTVMKIPVSFRSAPLRCRRADNIDDREIVVEASSPHVGEVQAEWGRRSCGWREGTAFGVKADTPTPAPHASAAPRKRRRPGRRADFNDARAVVHSMAGFVAGDTPLSMLRCRMLSFFAKASPDATVSHSNGSAESKRAE
eukprot:3756600-Rhodomonas_salina.2